MDGDEKMEVGGAQLLDGSERTHASIDHFNCPFFSIELWVTFHQLPLVEETQRRGCS